MRHRVAWPRSAANCSLRCCRAFSGKRDCPERPRTGNQLATRAAAVTGAQSRRHSDGRRSWKVRMPRRHGDRIIACQAASVPAGIAPDESPPPAATRSIAGPHSPTGMATCFGQLTGGGPNSASGPCTLPRRDPTAPRRFRRLVVRSVLDNPACGYPRCSMGCLGGSQNGFEDGHPPSRRTTRPSGSKDAAHPRPQTRRGLCRQVMVHLTTERGWGRCPRRCLTSGADSSLQSPRTARCGPDTAPSSRCCGARAAWR